MLTIRSAAALLAAATDSECLVRIAGVLGYDGPAVRLDSQLRSALAVPPNVVDCVLVEGQGSLRAITFRLEAGDQRDTITRMTSALTARAPHILWMLIGAGPDRAAVTIAAAIPGRRPPRAAALLVDRNRVVDSDGETLRLLAAARTDDDLGTQARFVVILGRDALSRRFFRTLQSCIIGMADGADRGTPAARAEIALLHASRMLFLGFLEAKGWLDGDPGFLANRFDRCMVDGGHFHRRVLLPLFFGTLNTPMRKRAPTARALGRIPFLNGGLFTPTAVERQNRGLRFSDESLGRILGDLFFRYRFTGREESTAMEEAAIDPEILGRAFESLMAAQTRRASGAFYTPYELVERVTTCAIDHALRGDGIGSGPIADGAGDGAPSSRTLAGDRMSSRRTPDLATLRRVRLLDPACGSGAFLVHALDTLSELHRAAGDQRATEAIRREVLSRSIFGVDVNPVAVWLCQLRLWLSIVIDTRDDDPGVIPPLPNLDRNIRIGDSLAGAGMRASSRADTGSARIRALRDRYVRSTGRKKATLSRMLDREERRRAIAAAEAQLAQVNASRCELIAARRGRNLFGGRYLPSRGEVRDAAELRQRAAELRRFIRRASDGQALPFSFAAHFADIAADGGFSVIVGNPPWVRPHRLPRPDREAYRRAFRVARAASWQSGAAAAGASSGFASQVDVSALFVERSLDLLTPGGTMSLLVPAKLWRSLSGGGVRDLLHRESTIHRVEDYSDATTTFDAAVYPGLIVASRPGLAAAADPASGASAPRRDESMDRPDDGAGAVSTGLAGIGLPDRPSGGHRVQLTVLHRHRTAATWVTEASRLGWDESVGAPWIMAPPEVRRAFDRLRAEGTPLADSCFGRPLLGVKCGVNDAFIVSLRSRSNGASRIASANGREMDVPTSMLRPVLRGQDVLRWRTPATADRIVWTHDAHGLPVQSLPPAVAGWLSPHRRALLARSDSRGSARWWSLFRVEAAAASAWRVAWADIGRTPRATVIAAGDTTVPLNSCYIARCPSETDALALATLINSPIIAAWLSLVAEPARGGYHRYLGWTMSLMPLPRNWETERVALAGIARLAMSGEPVGDETLVQRVAAAFHVAIRELEPLLTWASP